MLAIKSKAVGCELISKVMVLYIIDCVHPAVTHIINFSLDSGQYPTQWKKAYVRPLAKLPHSTPITLE